MLLLVMLTKIYRINEPDPFQANTFSMMKLNVSIIADQLTVASNPLIQESHARLSMKMILRRFQ